SFEVRLEVLHLFGSTTGEGEDIKRQGDVLLASEIVERNLVSERLVTQGKVWRLVPHFQCQWWRRGWSFFLLFFLFLRPQARTCSRAQKRKRSKQLDSSSTKHEFFPPHGLPAVKPKYRKVLRSIGRRCSWPDVSISRKRDSR